MTKRQTGRTRRALISAFEKAEKTGYCFFICLAQQMDYIISEIKKMNYEVDIVRSGDNSYKAYFDGGQVAIEPLYKTKLDYMTGRVLGSHPNCGVVVDHYALEASLAWALKEVTRYD